MNKIIGLLAFTTILAGCSDNSPHSHYVSSVNQADTIPGSILVDFKDGTSESEIKAIGDSLGISFAENSPTGHEYRYEIASVDPAKEDAILMVLSANSNVEHAEPMGKYTVSYVPNDPLYADQQWHMKRVGAENSWNMSCGQGVTVAVIDTGVACYDDKGFKRVSDLAGTKCMAGYNFVSDDEFAADDHAHGTHVAGTIAQTTNNGIGGAGLAPCVTIMPVKVLAAQGGGTSEGVASGIRYAADHGAQVINMSLGSSMPSDVIEDAVNYAYEKGVVIVAANGNDSGPVGYPAAFDHVIAVSATNERDDIAPFSSRGPQTAIGAPGTNVMQQTICEGDPGCETFSSFNGTSMATPHVAGAAALVVSSGITDPDAVRQKLQATSDEKSDHNKFGAGILRADSAVRSTLFSHFIGKALVLLGIVIFLRKKVKPALMKSKASMTGIILGGFGLFFLPFTGLLSRMGSFRLMGELASHPVVQWNEVLGFGHKFVMFSNVIPVALLSLVFLNSKLKHFVGGFSLGVAALCGQMAISNDVHFFLGSFIFRLWMVFSAVVSVYFAKAAFEKK